MRLSIVVNLKIKIMKKIKLLSVIAILILFPFILTYGYIAIDGLTSLAVFFVFKGLIRLNYSLYIIIEQIIGALISCAILGLPFGYIFSYKPVIFSSAVSVIAVLMLYSGLRHFSVQPIYWYEYIDFLAIVIFFVGFSILGSRIKRKVNNSIQPDTV